MESQDLTSTANVTEIGSLDKLENRIVEVVEQLRKAQELRLQAELEAEQLRGQLASKNRKLAQLQASAGSVEEQRGECRRRIESLLELVEKLG